MTGRTVLLACLCGIAFAATAAFADPIGLLWTLRPTVMPEASMHATMKSLLDVPWYIAPANPRNGLLVLHLVGFSLGFGSTLVLDAMLLRWMVFGRPSPGFAIVLQTLMHAVAIGLLLLWISGLGFLVTYALGDAAKLANPKLHAKIALVAVLTINGVVLHRRVLPLVIADATRPLLADVTPAARVAALACGALSAASWFFSFLLGLLRELNGRAGLTQILPVWLAIVFVILGGSSLILHDARRRLRKRERVAGLAGPATLQPS